MKSSLKKKKLSLRQFANFFSEPGDQKVIETYRQDFSACLSSMKLPAELISDLGDLYIPLINLLKKEKYFQTGKIPVIGISGSQGSGKSTFTDLLTSLLEKAYGYRVASFSIDDFYHSRATREILSYTIHPLLITRGVPGTHNVNTGFHVIDSLLTAEDNTITRIPVFDKSVDDQKPFDEWRLYKGRPDIILFEGWCVGAASQSPEQLSAPVNELEKIHDSDGKFRRFVNDQLAGDYKSWFSMIDFLIMFQVPSFDMVYGWRLLQEKKLAGKAQSTPDKLKPSRIMSEEEIRFFISHYERITKNILEEMPSRADMVLEIGEDHKFRSVRFN